jgi:hypothetical protein
MAALIIAFVTFVYTTAIMQFLLTIKERHGKQGESTQYNEEIHAPESIIASMYIYWKRRIDNAESVDEGADCLINAGQSAEQFKALIAQSMGIKTKDEIEAEVIAKSANVVLLREE